MRSYSPIPSAKTMKRQDRKTRRNQFVGLVFLLISSHVGSSFVLVPLRRNTFNLPRTYKSFGSCGGTGNNNNIENEVIHNGRIRRRVVYGRPYRCSIDSIVRKDTITLHAVVFTDDEKKHNISVSTVYFADPVETDGDDSNDNDNHNSNDDGPESVGTPRADTLYSMPPENYMSMTTSAGIRDTALIRERLSDLLVPERLSSNRERNQYNNGGDDNNNEDDSIADDFNSNDNSDDSIEEDDNDDESGGNERTGFESESKTISNSLYFAYRDAAENNYTTRTLASTTRSNNTLQTDLEPDATIPTAKKGQLDQDGDTSQGSTGNHFFSKSFFSPLRTFLSRSHSCLPRPWKLRREAQETAGAPQPEQQTEVETNDLISASNITALEEPLSIRRLWRRRHARTLEEGIRRERATELSDLLSRAQIDARKGQGRRYVERILMGLINALAEEIDDLDVELAAIPKTPLWRKEVKEIRINFSRLGFKPLQLGGNEMPDKTEVEVVTNTEKASTTELSSVDCADEAFDRIDTDNSGTLDREEMAQALSMISTPETDKESIEGLASDLVDLYDANSDGVVDREEYQQMIEDMAALRPSNQNGDDDGSSNGSGNGPLGAVKKSMQSISEGISKKAAEVASKASAVAASIDGNINNADGPYIPEKEMGSILLSDLNLDLRRLLFGGVPIIKRITPGGPLILEPFTVTVNGSFSREDVMGSFMLDSGLRLLVARALRLRVRSFRDFVDGALFFGRRWKMTSKSAPVVEVLGLSNIEFDSKDKMIITGRARVRTSPDAPVVTNTFKVRTKIGTRKDGQVIRLVEPELAFVFECPQAWENGLRFVCEQLGVPSLKRPEPLYSFFPIYSPFKVNDNAGFDMGDDNRLHNIFIKDGRLRFEMRSVLRPGRFLGNHYIAFTVPNRTFIITMDRVREGIRAARQNKKIAAREKKIAEQFKPKQPGTSTVVGKRPNYRRNNIALSDSTTPPSSRTLQQQQAARILKKRLTPRPKSFFSRFVEGYTLVEREGEANNERLATEISNWFGRQGTSITTSPTTTTDENPTDGAGTTATTNMPSTSPIDDNDQNPAS